MKKIINYLLGLLLLLALILIINKYYSWSDLFSPWQQLSSTVLPAAVGLIIVSYALRALRIYDYFRGENSVNFVAIGKLFLQHNFLNNLLPMRAGELSFPILMSRYCQISVSQSIPALLWFRLLDLHTLILFAVLMVLAPTVHVVLLLIIGLCLLSIPWWIFISNHWIKTKVEARHGTKLSRLLLEAIASLPQTPPELFRSWFWTLANWLVKISVLAWLMMQFIEVNWSVAWLAILAGDFTTVLPIHGIAGAGTYEAGVVAALVPFNITTKLALSAAVNVHLFILGASFIGAIIGLILPVNNNHASISSQTTTEGRHAD